MPPTAAPMWTGELTDTHLPGFDSVTAAFDRFTAGDDDGALAALDAIGLTSPLLPWKLMVRGLIAWRSREDARARDNWRRLPADSMPARLIAPLRAEVDLEFRRSVGPDELAQLRLRYKAVAGGRLSASLKKLREQFGRRPPEQIIARAVPLLEPLQRLAPNGPAQLTEALSCLLCDQGRGDDLATFTLHFPPPDDDPRFDRLSALVSEAEGQLAQAVVAWRDFEALLAERPALFGTAVKRARALIWGRIAELEWKLTRANSNTTAAAGPNPKASVQRSLELAPDYRPALRLQFAMAVAAGRLPSILKAGREVLRHHPQCVRTLATLASACREKGKREDGLEFSRSLHEHAPLDPLNRDLYVGDLRAVARQKLRFNDRTGLSMLDRAAELNPNSPATNALRAALAFRAGQDATAKDLVARSGRHRAEIALRMLGEAECFDLPKVVKRFEPTVRKALEGSATARVCTALMDAYADQVCDHLTYTAQHEIERTLPMKVHAAGLKAKAADLPDLFAATRRAGWAFQLARLFFEIEHKHANDPLLPFEVALALLSMGPRHLERAAAFARKTLARLQRMPIEKRPSGVADTLEEFFGPLLRQRDSFDELVGGFFFEDTR